MTDQITRLVETLLPVLVMAGDYARTIQPSIQPANQKQGGNAWTQALTDADLMVQNFIEVAALAHWPDIGFYGEESEHSVNSKYFPPSARTVIQLDPINGTFLYQNQQSGWDIVLSIRHDNRLEAAVSYMPAKGIFYLATRATGALTGNRSCLRLQDMQSLKTVSGSRLCLTYRAQDASHKLEKSFDCFDIVEDYSPSRNFESLNDLFTGKLDAIVSRTDDLLDWGATAFIAQLAGGCISHLDGKPFNLFDNFDPREPAEILVASSAAVHDELLALLQEPQ